MRDAQRLAVLADRLAELGGLLLVAAAAVAFVNVVTRKLFSYPFSWSDELVGFLGVWVVYLPLALLERTRSHLWVSVVYDLCPPSLKRWLRRAQDVIVAGLLLYLAYIGLGVVRLNAAQHVESPTLGIPMALLYAVMPICFVLGALARLLGLASTGTGHDRKDGAEHGC